MSAPARAALAFAVAFGLAACGGGGGEEKAAATKTPATRTATPSPAATEDERLIRRTMARWLLASVRRDVPGMCAAMTPASRKLLARKGRQVGVTGGCAAVLGANPDLLAPPRGGTAAGAEASAARIPVRVDGDRAVAEIDGDPIPLRRTREGWGLDLVEAVG